MKKFIKEFKEFAASGNLIDMAVGIIIGAAIGKIISSFVSSIVMPLLSLVLGKVNISNLFIVLSKTQVATLEEAEKLGLTVMQYGVFLQSLIDFFFQALALFIVLKIMMKLKKKKEEPVAETPKLCPFCKMEVAKDAVKCPHCISDIAE